VAKFLTEPSTLRRISDAAPGEAPIEVLLSEAVLIDTSLHSVSGTCAYQNSYLFYVQVDDFLSFSKDLATHHNLPEVQAAIGGLLERIRQWKKDCKAAGKQAGHREKRSLVNFPHWHFCH
jgi:hypothetical protein